MFGLRQGRHRRPANTRSRDLVVRGVPTLARVMALGLGTFLLLISVGHPSASAAWTGQGEGVGTATVASLASPAAVSVSSVGADVTVTWTEPVPPEGVLDGYRVTRFADASPTDACGTDSVTFIPAGTATCMDSGVADGTYTYLVSAVFRTWTAESEQSNAVTVVGDVTKPSQSVSMAGGASNAYLAGTNLYYRSTVVGSFQLVDTVSGSPADPASATFPEVTESGWSHAAETVTSGTGSAPTIAYTSSAYSWTTSPTTPSAHTVTGSNVLADTVNTTLAITPDDSGPTGGALTVNGTVATGTPSVSSAHATFAINARTEYAVDAGAGVASSVLTRSFATLTSNNCGSFGAPVTLAGVPTQAGMATGCHLYTLTGTDRLGNASSVSTIVRYDVSVPAQVVTSTSSVNTVQTSNVIYYRSDLGGSFSLSTALTDNQTSPASVTYPAVPAVGWTHAAETVTSGTGSAPTITYASSTYSIAVGASAAATHNVVGKDTENNSVTTGITFTDDMTAPTGGVVTIGGVASSTSGTSSYNITGSPTIARTDYTDALSGIASSVLIRESAPLSANTCGTFGSPATVVGTTAQTGLTTGCWRYTLTGTDRLGNVATPTSTTVKVDLAVPTGGALSVNGLAANGAGTSMVTNTTSFAIDSRTEWTDLESGLASSTLVRTVAPYTGVNCGAFATPTTLIGTPAQTGLTTNCYRYTLTGTDNAGNAVSVITTIKNDMTAPTGALTVNGLAASGAGSTSSANVSSYAIVRTDYTDAASGILSSTLTRQFATLTGSTCGSFGSTTTIVGAPAQTGLATGCYLYTLTGVDNAGNSASVSTTVKLGPYVSALALTNKAGGTAGLIEQGDKIVITYSDDIAVSTLCSTWAGDLTDQVLNGDNQVTVTLTNGTGGSNPDVITVSSSVCTLNFGALDVNKGFTTATRTYGGAGANVSTLAWNAAARQFTITFGLPSGATATTVNTSADYRPSASVLNLTSVPLGTGIFSTPNARQF